MWLKWNRWSRAILLSQEPVLSAAARRMSGEASEGLATALGRSAIFELFRQLVGAYLHRSLV